jgi:tRNA modification GTPase
VGQHLCRQITYCCHHNRFGFDIIMENTIFALASGPGPAGIAIIRISGPEAGKVFPALARRTIPVARSAVRVHLMAPGAKESDEDNVLDDGLALWFPGPASFTGEDVVEFHIHGGAATVTAVMAALSALPGLRGAEAGEFTRRAFANGKLDLTQAEGLADLVAAETDAQRRQARRQLGGALGALYEGWRGRLIDATARLEAAMDFADEDLPKDLVDGLIPDILGLRKEITQHLDDHRRGEWLRDGFAIAILGAPNVGKSSLLNTLARRDAAIVSATAGTTRDVIEVHLDLGGLPVILADTAGLRASADEVEEEGVRRARARAADAGLKLAVFDATAWPELDHETLALVDEDTIVVLNKRDIKDLSDSTDGSLTVVTPSGKTSALLISAKTGSGIAELLVALQDAANLRLAPTESPALTRERHRGALAEAAGALDRVTAGLAPELVAEELRLAARAMGRITGRVDVEDILDRVFAEFCIGK